MSVAADRSRPSARRPALLGGLLALALAGCTTTSGIDSASPAPAWATNACSDGPVQMAISYGNDARLVATFGLSGAQMTAWQDSVRGPRVPQLVASIWRARASDSVAVCYFDGTFDLSKRYSPGGGPLGASDTATAPPRFERLIVIRGATGIPILYAAGLAGDLPLENPASY